MEDLHGSHPKYTLNKFTLLTILLFFSKQEAVGEDLESERKLTIIHYITTVRITFIHFYLISSQYFSKGGPH